VPCYGRGDEKLAASSRLSRFCNHQIFFDRIMVSGRMFCEANPKLLTLGMLLRWLVKISKNECI
jgi:hypothetical protein